MLSFGVRQDVGGNGGDVGNRLCAVDHPEDYRCLIEFLERPLNTHCLYSIGGLAYACCVDKPKCQSAERYGVLYHVARCAADVAHERLVVVQQPVEEC